MKRSIRLYIRAKNSAWWTLFFLVLSVALGAWFVRCALTDHWATLTLAVCALTSLYATFAQAGETRRLLDLADREQGEELRRMQGPRI